MPIRSGYLMLMAIVIGFVDACERTLVDMVPMWGGKLILLCKKDSQFEKTAAHPKAAFYSKFYDCKKLAIRLC